MSRNGITLHTLIKNEERFVWYALMSVINWADEILVYDTGSTDKTVEIVRSINSKKIKFEEKGEADKKRLIDLRQDQIERTRTEWFYLLDGDEIYPQKTLEAVAQSIKSASDVKQGLYLPFYNLVGDVYHRQKDKFGRYEIGNIKGHINLRGIKKTPGLKVIGEYPLEAYVNSKGEKIQDVGGEGLVYVGEPYWHAGSLVRSHLDQGVLERRVVYDVGIRIQQKLPGVFSKKRPAIVPNVMHERSRSFILVSLMLYMLREIKSWK